MFGERPSPNMDMGWYDAVDGQRVITMFNPIMGHYEGYDHAVKLLRKSAERFDERVWRRWTPETEEEFGNDPVLYI